MSVSAALSLQPLRLQTMATGSVDDAIGDVVLLHGWGTDSRVWQRLVPLLRPRCRVHLLDLPGFGGNRDVNLWRDEPALLAALAAVLPATAHLVGWSLGGNVALAYARRYPLRVRSLSLIATNPAFVARDGWPCAMPEEIFAGFEQLLAAQPAKALQRFAQLQCHGDGHGRRLALCLRELPGGPLQFDRGAVRDALEFLRRVDQRAYRAQSAPLYILGEADALVPASVAAQLPCVRVLPQTAHLPMLTQPQALAELLFGHMARPEPAGPGQQKARIAHSFSAAAASYDGVAELQRQVGTDLLARLELPVSAGPALDLGCGTGYFLPRLQQAVPACEWLGGDLAEGMLRYARGARGLGGVPLLALDAERLPLADACLAGIYSNLALQWCQDLDGLFAEAHRVLRPGGWCALSTLLDGTLAELRASWRSVDDREHVNRFLSDREWRSAAERAGLRPLVWRQETRVTYYAELAELVHELKALGAHNLNEGRPGGLTGKGRWRALRSAYEACRQRQGLPASWQVLYAVLVRD